MNDCLWCGSFAHDYDQCPSRAEATERQRQYAELEAALASTLATDMQRAGYLRQIRATPTDRQEQ